MDNEFQDKVIIVTGASSGIGKEISMSLLRAGAKVAACSRDSGKLETLKNAHTSGNGELLTIPCDVSQSKAVSEMVDHTLEHFGTVHALVNNAGLYPSTPLLDLLEEEWDQVLDTNLKGPFLCSKAIAKFMISHNIKGRIVNVSSTASLIARPGVVHYASSKAGLNMLTKVLAVELAPYGMRINAVLPGLILTEGVQSQLTGADSEREHRTKLTRIPLGAEGKPDHVVSAVLYFLSEKSEYCTGSLLVVDGGYSLGIPSYGG